MYKKYSLLTLVFCCGLLAAASAQVEADLAGSSQMSEAEIKEIGEHWDELEKAGDQFGDLAENFGDLLKTVKSAKDLYDAAKALDDNECVPDLTTDANAMMPTGCKTEENCSECYEKGIGRLNHVRKTLARMACLRINTKTYVESAIAFGDDVSGIHGAMAIAWQNEKIGIKKSYEKFKKTYDKKYLEMMQSLEISLKDISVCEAQFGMQDWYQKSGFIYLEIMKEKYKRTD
jgi:hypothetical protein